MAHHGGIHPQRTPIVPTRTLQEAPNTPSAPPAQQETVTLVLRPRKKVSWHVETVDNEHMQKKSSKICCVYHKKERLEDSGDEDEDSGYEGKGKGLCHHQSDEEDDCEHKGKGNGLSHRQSDEEDEGGYEGKGKGHFYHPSAEVAESSKRSKE